MSNLNETQKHILRWFVNEAYKGKLDENEINILWSFDGTDIINYTDEVPEIKETSLEALEIEGYLICKKKKQGYACSLTAKAYEAVENNFKTDKIVRDDSSKKVIYNLHGNNSRVNINSSDSSINIVDKSTKEFFADLRKTVDNDISSPDKEKLLQKISELENAKDSNSFSKKYSEFMAIAANHTTVLAPYFPALVQFLTQ